MKLMRNKRTGRNVVYDESLLKLGTYEVVEDAIKQQQTVPEQRREPINLFPGDVIQIKSKRVG